MLTNHGCLAEPSKDIVSTLKWCVGQAQAAGPYKPGQRCFRFTGGRYVGALPPPGLQATHEPKPGSCNPM